MKWIKTIDQLPEMEVPVLAGWFDRKGEFAYHAFMRSDSCGDGWVWAISCDNMISLGDEFIEDDDYSNITHWMPLPQPPQQEVKSALEIGMSRYAGAMQKLAEGGD